ncbi:MAG: zf-TFIIB domain-containing protein [Candidatus Rokubacteria bacterium]|nr:zf-TFIIB domain-containing protein [Candidatus Rokubacteria bacterium]
MSVKPTQQEEEYFARLEFERRRKALDERESQAAEEERQRILAVARGRCPKCGAELVPVPYRGIELDKCSRCQGVWLDFGELDQVVAEDKGFLGSVRRIFS